MPLRSFFLLLILPFLALARPAFAEEEKLPLPRFASLRSGEVNMRVGPGTDYEVLWIYRRKSLPVEIIEEFDTWRKIRDADGTTGWVHQNMLSGKRTALVLGQRRALRKDPSDTAPPRAFLDPGIVVTLEECQKDWCEVEAPGRIGGWLSRHEVWGIYPSEQLP